MMHAIIREIQLTTPFNDEGQKEIETLYFGGGTPSIIPLSFMDEILNALHEKFRFAANAEFTLEANPDDINPGQLAAWRSMGVNRFSLGVQDFHAAGLKWMNRVHSAEQSLSSIDMIRAAGFENFSIDLIYGLPVLSDADWNRNLELVTERDIPHVSCYALTVEAGTALEKMIVQNKKEGVDTEKQARHFEILMERMEQSGYAHYEISNFAKPGFQSRHNSSYWQGKPYYGFGPAAHSFHANIRRWNIAHNALYIRSIEQGQIPFEEEVLTPVQQVNEYIMTALRTSKGIDLAFLSERFGAEKTEKLKSKLNRIMDGHYLETDGQMIKLTREGKLFADGMAASLFLD